MSHRLSKWGVSLFLMLGFVLAGGVSEAAEAEPETYGIHIVKYRIEEGTSFPKDLPQDGRKLEKVTDQEGNTLQPLGNITYQITKVHLKESGLPVTEVGSYEPTTGEDAFTVSLVTDVEGSAELTGLAEGVYQVEERANDLLKTPMEPLLVHLPMVHGGERLTQVYVYPKSSITTSKPAPDPSKKLPQTSGSIGQATQMIWMLGLVLGMGVLGIRVSRQRRQG